jgi:hypothetical protein
MTLLRAFSQPGKSRVVDDRGINGVGQRSLKATCKLHAFPDSASMKIAMYLHMPSRAASVPVIGLTLLFGPFAMESPTIPGKESNGEKPKCAD